MADPYQLKVLLQGVTVWNRWRLASSRLVPDLTDISCTDSKIPDLTGADFTSCKLKGADFSNVKLSNTKFTSADLRQTHFCHATLWYADFTRADLTEADLRSAHLTGTRIARASLKNADLRGADFRYVELWNTNLSHANFNDSEFGQTNLSNLNMAGANGLETAHHQSPSFVSIDTLYLSQGRIPEKFLRDAGVPEEIIEVTRAIRCGPAIQWNSCFISYSTKDEDFARRLHSRMREANVRVWFAPEDLKGGKKLHEQLFEAIQIHDRLLLVLSEHSVKSEWVMTEIRKAREVEKRENRRKLFPVRLMDFDTLRDWTCFDADSGKDLAAEVREYFIPDFSNWKDHDAFEKAFARLQSDLKAETKTV